MALVEFNADPTDRQLKQFGGVCVLALPLVAWLWTGSSGTVLVAAGAGAVLCAIGMVAPGILKPVFVGLTILTIPIGMLVGELALLLIYFGVFLPLGLVFRITGRDSMQRKPASDAETYWEQRTPVKDARRYYQQW